MFVRVCSLENMVACIDVQVYSLLKQARPCALHIPAPIYLHFCTYAFARYGRAQLAKSAISGHFRYHISNVCAPNRNELVFIEFHIS
jgi:hypothetical protein